MKIQIQKTKLIDAVNFLPSSEIISINFIQKSNVNSSETKSYTYESLTTEQKKVYDDFKKLITELN